MQKGVSMCMRQNEFLFRKTAFAPVFGLFAAKCGAFWCKMTCVLVLNATRFGAKCNAFWCKTQGKMVLNAVFFAAKCEPKSIKIRRNGINIVL